MTVRTIAKKHPRSAITIGITLVMIGVLLFTHFGVFLVFDVAGDLRGTDNFTTTYRDAPVRVSHILDTPEEITLPAHIAQVSGIYVSPGSIALSTDQAELFIMTHYGQVTYENGNLLWPRPLLLRQGRLEAVTMRGETYQLAGEHGGIVVASTTAQRQNDIALPQALTSTEITGITAYIGRYAVVADGTADLMIYDPATSETVIHKLGFGPWLITGAGTAEILWSGVSHHADMLYLIAENYPLIAVVDAKTFAVVDIFGIEGQHEFSDIAVHAGKIYLPSDHNFFDPRPPLRVYDMP